MKKVLLFLLITALALSAVACNTSSDTVPSPSPTTEPSIMPSPTPSPTPTPDPSPSPTPPTFNLTAENFPLLDGSTATIPLAEAMVATLLGIPRSEATEYVNFSGTSTAWSWFFLGPNDNNNLIIAYEGNYGYSEDEGLIIAPIGRDALVFLVNAANPIDDITEEQIIAIYRGEITNWSQLGGDDGEIIPYQRNYSSGSQTMFRKLVVGAAELAEPPGELVHTEMGSLYLAIADYNNGSRAIGYNVFYYVTQMKSDINVKILSVNGVTPSSETIASGEYPYCNDFFAAIRADTPVDSATYAVFTWLQGEQARDLMLHEHYVPLLP